MNKTIQQRDLAEDALDALIGAMSVGQDRAYNGRRLLAAIQRGEIPGVSFYTPSVTPED